MSPIIKRQRPISERSVAQQQLFSSPDVASRDEAVRSRFVGTECSIVVISSGDI
jgi:hypothetical protein